MTVAELQKLLADRSQDAVIVVNFQDNYSVARVASLIELTGDYDVAWDHDKNERVTGQAVFISL